MNFCLSLKPSGGSGQCNTAVWRSGEAEFSSTPTNGWNGLPESSGTAAATWCVLQWRRKDYWTDFGNIEVILQKKKKILRTSWVFWSILMCFVFWRFVRREKEIAMTRCEASEEETLRHKQRTEHQKQEIMEIQEALNAEREKMQVSV